MGQTGGAQSHTLSVGEMPAHIHEVPRDDRTPGSIDARGAGTESGGTNPDRPQHPFNTESTGNNQPHINVQPSIVLNYS